MRYVLALFLMLAPMASAQEVVVGMSDDEVGIDTFFDGSELFIYGAIRPGAGNLVSFEGDFDVIITLASPLEPVTV
ncbi:MAG: TIGR02186 family protein, partial [Planktomarina sp.]